MLRSRLIRYRRDLAAVLAITAVVLGMYLPPVLSGKTLVDNPALMDVSTFFYPDVSWAARAWWGGDFPLWNPHSTCGAPLLAYTATGALYPVTVVLYGLLPYLTAGSIGIIFHTLLASLLMFVGLRQLRVPSWPAALGGLMFVFSGLFFGFLYMVPLPGSFAWAVGFLVLFRALVRRPTTPRFLGCAAAVSLSAVSGDPEVFAFGAMTVGLAVFLGHVSEVRRWPRIIALYFPPVALAVLLILPFFLAAVENAYFSMRGPLMPYQIDTTTLTHWGLLLPTWLFPFKYFAEKAGALATFNHGLSPIFQGVLVAPAGLIALVRARRDKVMLGLALTWVCLALYILSTEVPWSRELVTRIPLLGMLKVPGKALCFIELLNLMLVFLLLNQTAVAKGRGLRLTMSIVLMLGGLAVLIAQPWCQGGGERYALGVTDLVLGAAFAGGTIRRSAWSSGPRLAGVFALMMVLEVLLMAGRSIPESDPKVWELPPELKRLNLDLGGGTRFAVFEQFLPLTVSDPPALFGRFGVASKGANFTGPSRVYPVWGFLYQSLINGGLVISEGGGAKSLNIFSLANPGDIRRDRMHLFNLTGVRLILTRDVAFPFTSPYSLLRRNAVVLDAGAGAMEIKGQPPAMILTGPTNLETSLSALSGDRLAVVGRAVSAGELMLSSRPREGERKVLAALAVRPMQQVSLELPLETLHHGGSLRLSWEPGSDKEGKIEINRLEIDNPARPFQRFFESGGIEIFTNRDALPRAFLVHQSRVAPNLLAEQADISDSEKFPPARTAVLNAPLADPDSTMIGRSAPTDQVTITSYGSNRVTMTSRSLSPGILVFTDTYFPGWKARINQGSGWAETRIVRADLAFRAIRVPAGLSRIEWSYEPASFRVGLWSSLAALWSALTAAGIWIAGRYRVRSFPA